MISNIDLQCVCMNYYDIQVKQVLANSKNGALNMEVILILLEGFELASPIVFRLRLKKK